MAESLAADSNIIISHSKINDSGGVTPTADVKIAELQTINAKVAKGATVAVNPNYKSKFEAKVVEEKEEVDEDFDEKPHIKVGHWTPPIKNVAASVTTPAPVTDAINPELKSQMEAAIFKDFKKTAKSSAIIGYLLANANKEVPVADIAKGSGIDNAAVSIWLATTAAEKVKAIKNISRGVWFFDSSKVKI